MKTKGRRKSDNIIDMRPGKSGDPMFESARKMAKNAEDYRQVDRTRRMTERLKAGAKGRPKVDLNKMKDAIRKRQEKKK